MPIPKLNMSEAVDSQVRETIRKSNKENQNKNICNSVYSVYWTPIQINFHIIVRIPRWGARLVSIVPMKIDRKYKT